MTDTNPTRNIFQENNFIDVDVASEEDLQQRLMIGSRKDPKQKPREQKMGLIVFYIVILTKHKLEEGIKLFKSFPLKLCFIFHSFEQEQQITLIVSSFSIFPTVLTFITGPMWILLPTEASSLILFTNLTCLFIKLTSYHVFWIRISTLQIKHVRITVRYNN